MATFVALLRGINVGNAGKALLGKIGGSATTRNLASVLKIRALANPRDA